MLHAFRVHFSDITGNADGFQEVENDIVALLAPPGQSQSVFRQKKGTVFPVTDQPFPIQAENHFIDRGMGYPETGGQIDHPGLALRLDQISDQLDIILSGFGLMGFAHPGEPSGLMGRVGQFFMIFGHVWMVYYIFPPVKYVALAKFCAINFIYEHRNSL